MGEKNSLQTNNQNASIECIHESVLQEDASDTMLSINQQSGLDLQKQYEDDLRLVDTYKSLDGRKIHLTDDTMFVVNTANKAIAKILQLCAQTDTSAKKLGVRSYRGLTVKTLKLLDFKGLSSIRQSF